MLGEILLARQHQTRGLTGEPRLDDARRQLEYVGLALILGCRRDFPCNYSAPCQQRGFNFSGSYRDRGSNRDSGRQQYGAAQPS